MVSLVELGQRNVSIETLGRICSALDEELVVGIEEPLQAQDRMILERLRCLLPNLDPALKATLTVLVDAWESSESSDRQENVKAG